MLEVAKRRTIYELPLQGEITKEDDLWIARSELWGLTTYGSSREEALRRMSRAVTMYASALARRGALDDQLRRAGTAFRTHAVQDDSSRTRFWKQFRTESSAPFDTPASSRFHLREAVLV